jgi:hypothetical protein
MIDRQNLEALLTRRFPGATASQIAAAANAIMGLEDEWEEVGNDEDFGYQSAAACTDVCALAREADAWTEFRLLRRRAPIAVRTGQNRQTAIRRPWTGAGG